MNLTDDFVQVIDRPTKKWELRSDLHWLQLTSGKIFGIRAAAHSTTRFSVSQDARATGSRRSLCLADVSSDWHATSHLDVNLYYGHGWGKTVVKKIYPAGQTAQLGYLELVYHWDSPFSAHH